MARGIHRKTGSRRSVGCWSTRYLLLHQLISLRFGSNSNTTLNSPISIITLLSYSLAPRYISHGLLWFVSRVSIGLDWTGLNCLIVEFDWTVCVRWFVCYDWVINLQLLFLVQLNIMKLIFLLLGITRRCLAANVMWKV